MDKARLGTVYLSVPKIRQGGYIPFFVTEKKRSEQALIQVVQECWLNGVSTRKIESIAKRQYAAPSMEPAGRGARFISCGIYLTQSGFILEKLED